MGLYDRWVGTTEDNKIAVHVFGAGLSELARGAVTKQQLVDAFNLDAAEETELDAIIATYQGLGSAVEQYRFIGKLEDVMILSESGFYTEAKAKSELGF